jgi:plastocyanin
MKRINVLLTLSLAGLAWAHPTVVYAPDAATSAEDCCVDEALLQNVFVIAAEDTKGTGKAHGRVLFDGTVIKAQPLSIPEAQTKGCTDGDSKVNARDLRLLVHEDKGIANAVVTVEVPNQTLRVPTQSILLDQVQCRFDQHVIVVPVGTTLEYKNSDTVAHNVHTYSRKNKAFNRTLPAGVSYEQTLSKAETIQVSCDFHPWMRAYVFVADTNYAALTDEHGNFSIPGLAPGEYSAKIWHEKLGRASAKITIGPGGESEAVEVMMAPKKKRGR